MPILKQFTVNDMLVKVYQNREEMGKSAAEDVAKCLRKTLAEKDEVNMVFAAAPSQNEFLQFLCVQPGIDWGRVNAFHMDEYIGLSSDEEQSFVHYLTDHITGKIPFRNFFPIHGNVEDVETECLRYEKLIADRQIDIVCLGIGENGHIAFNDPHEAYIFDEKLVKTVSLDEKCRMQQVNDKCFRCIKDVPRKAITLTVSALMRGRNLFCTVPSALKAEAVREVVFGEIRNRFPATSMKLHKHVKLYCDKDSAAYILGDERNGIL